MDYKKNKKYYIVSLLSMFLLALVLTSCTKASQASVEKRLKKQNRIKKRKNCDCTAA